jgi:tetratricopeptide (TPR) repeat protein
MPRNKSKQARRADELAKPRSEQGISWKTVAAILGSITALVGAIVNWMDFINKFREGYQQFLWLIVVLLGVIWLIVFWLLFKQRNAYGILWLAVTIVGGVAIWSGSRSYIQTREDRLIVLIAKFDDTKGDYYELRDEIFDKLSQDFEYDDRVQIEKLNEIITEDNGSGTPRARNIGKKYQADLVIWGSYRQTQNPNIKINIENLTAEQLVTLKEGNMFKPSATLVELESFTFQQKAGRETSALISFLAGYLQYKSKNYDLAIERFDKSLETIQGEPGVFENQWNVYLYRGNAYLFLNNYERALQDYDKLIEIDPQDGDVYFNRGLVYERMGQNVLAFLDYDKAIEINPQDGDAHINRGLIYVELGQNEAALQDFDKAIEINPEDAEAYSDRGAIYVNLMHYERAIQDFDKAIEIDPELAGAYYNRSIAYRKLGKTAEAEADFKKYEELTGQKP